MEITLPQLRILFRVRARPGIDLRSLATELGITASGAGQQVDKLVARGFVRRNEDPEDRRRIQLVLTELGQLAMGDISRASRAYLVAILAVLSDEELDLLQRLLGRVVAAAAKVSVPPI
ncbi:MAG: MarR family transcriptional regulator [Chloroflexota bacterium]